MALSFDPDSVLRADFYKIRRLSRQDPKKAQVLIAQSQARLAQRQQLTNTISYPEQLPISVHAQEICQLIQTHQVVVVAGETGSGKTTQLPKICLQAGYGRHGMIGHTQPRRLAARTVATRIASELEVSLGGQVGFAVRFTDQTDDTTQVKLMTDGLLLMEIRRDKFLNAYDVIIVDEAHERSLNVDFLLGYLKGLVKRRPDLRVIITSATIDVVAFAKHFGNAPVVEVGGRGYPVALRYHESDLPDVDKILACIAQIDAEPVQGAATDTLVFLTGEREIFDTAKKLRRALGERKEVLPLYARLSVKDQQRVFSAGRLPRIILATNVAETSLTVPNIGFVIDLGEARVSRYSYRSKLQRLPIEAVSQASANQRAGRCGRVAPGVCWRLYSEQDFQGRAEFTDPEIRRTNLAAVVLQMHAFGLGDIRTFDFLDPPQPGAVSDAFRLLEELQALKDNKLTKLGRQMAQLPIDPRLARMLLAADQHRCLTEMLVIASALSVQDPKERPYDKQGQADAVHEQFSDERSDFLGWVNLWQWLENLRDSASRNGFTKALNQRFLNPARVREWRALHTQLKLAANQLGLRRNDIPADYSGLHSSILSGSLSLIAQHDERGHYQGARNLRLRIFPGSAVAAKTPAWIVASEIAETQRVYARGVAAVQARWIERSASHLVKRTFTEPHWSRKRGEVMAYETVTLYGLRLCEKRQVSYQRVDPEACRSLFLDALVRGDLAIVVPAVADNQNLIVGLMEEEAKGRRRDLLISDQSQAALYDGAVPAEIISTRALQKWLGNSPDHHEVIRFSVAELTHNDSHLSSADDYPTQLEVGGIDCELIYRFAPGEQDDGVSLRVPVGALSTIAHHEDFLAWQVPGFFPALCEAWLRTLPRAKRKLLAPIVDTVQTLLPVLMRRYRQGRLLPALAEVIADLMKVNIVAADWDRSRLDTHLLINTQVIGEKKRLLAQGRELAPLQAQFSAAVEQQIAAQNDHQLAQSGLLQFPSQALTDKLKLTSEGLVVYPGLVDEGDSIGVQLFATPLERDRAARAGYTRLAILTTTQSMRYFKKQIQRRSDLGLHYATLGTMAQLSEQILGHICWQCFFQNQELPTTDESFKLLIEAGRGQLGEIYEDAIRLVEQTLSLRFELSNALNSMKSPAFGPAIEDLRAQLAQIAPADFLSQTPVGNLDQLPRYMDAMSYRLANLQGKLVKDEERMAVVHGFEARYLRLAELLEPLVCDELRIQLQEIRVALFAESMKLPKISPSRLDRRFKALEMDLGLR